MSAGRAGPAAAGAPDLPSLSEQVSDHARRRPDAVALIHDDRQATYAELDGLVNRVAAALQRDGAGEGAAVALCASASIRYMAAFIAAGRVGATVVPLATGLTADALAAMLADADAAIVLADAAALAGGVRAPPGAAVIALDGAAGGRDWATWLAPPGARPHPARIDPEAPFSVIYSSGTTGTPKGIVHSRAMRARLIAAQQPLGYDGTAVTLVSTPPYSNTTLTSLLPALAGGGAVVLMTRFDAGEFLRLAERHRVTHAMLVPVQYRRILAHPDFDRRDLSSFRLKFCTSAPFAAELKRETLARWPGGLVEFFGLTEGGGSCVLLAHLHPDKLHTVGVPAPGHDIRLVDEAGREVAAGEVGEIVGRSGSVMTGYRNRPAESEQAIWTSPDGGRFLRTGDVGRFDADGFLTIVDRKKDLIISGGFNIYPSDLEEALRAHPAVRDAAVVGVPDARWGETPVGFVVAEGAAPDDILAFANAGLGRTQRLSRVLAINELPRSDIGKVLRRELRDRLPG